MSFSYSAFWSDIYFESIIEHDPRLRSIYGEILNDFDPIIDADWAAAKNDVRSASHPIAIYLNKLAPKSQRFNKMNENVIYKRHHPARVPLAADTGVFRSDGTKRIRYVRGFDAWDMIKINPRNRWFKIYEVLGSRPRYLHYQAQLDRAIQAQSQFIKRMNQMKLLQEVSWFP